MAFQRRAISPVAQARLREMAGEMRRLLYGEAGFPEWGTRFAAIEQDGMKMGLELARLMMEQSVSEQAEHVPESALKVAGEEVFPAGVEEASVETGAGIVTWDQPRKYLNRSRQAFFPPQPSAGTAGG